MTIYSNSKIYRIIDNTNGLQYFGSTTVGLSQRLAQHNYSFNRWKCGKTNYTSSYKILENGDYTIILVEEVPCENNEQLRRRERFHIEGNECVNIRIPLQTSAEFIQYQQQYRTENRTDLYMKQNAKHTCCCGGKYTYQNKLIHLTTKKHREYALNQTPE